MLLAIRHVSLVYNWLCRAYEIPYGRILEFVPRTRKTDRQIAQTQ